MRTKQKVILGFCALYLVVSALWLIVQASRGDGTALVMLALGVPLGAFVAGFTLCTGWKKLFLGVFAPPQLRAAQPSEFPRLDAPELERLTRAWESFGFEQRADYAGGEANPTRGPAFSRLLEHPTEGVLVELSQHFSPMRDSPLTSSVVSFWGDRNEVLAESKRLQAVAAPAPLASPQAPAQRREAEDSRYELSLWMAMTHNREPNRFYKLFRQPRLLSLRLAKTAWPEDLWRAHLERCIEIEARLQTPRLRGELAPLLEAHAHVQNALSSRRASKTPAWKFGAAFISRAPVPARYDGELPA